MMNKYKLYLFDFDGTLFNTEKALIFIFKEAFGSVGIEVKPEDSIRISRQPLPVTYKELHGDETRIPEFIKKIDELVNSKRSVEYTECFDDTMEFMSSIRNSGVQAGIVTSNNIVHVKDVLEYFSIPTDTFNVYVGNKETDKVKPDPGPIQLAIEFAGYEGELKDVVYVGDALNDVKAAKNAGITAILLDRRNEYPDGDYIKISSLNEIDL